MAEDDVRLAALLEQALDEAGWTVHVVHDDRSAYVKNLLAGHGPNRVPRHQDHPGARIHESCALRAAM